MGSKHASVHLRCDESSLIIARLKKEFGKKKGPTEKDQLAMKIIMAFANKNIASIKDPQERAEKEAVLAETMRQAETDIYERDPAVIVVREHFVSVYWYDHIRAENLRSETLEYAAAHGVPALGVACYDDTNFQIYAVRDAGTRNVRKCFGEYLFDFDDITPVTAEDICDVIDTPFLLDGLSEVLACEEGETMANMFEKKTGLSVFTWADECKECGMKLLYDLEGAKIYSAVGL